MIRVLIAEDSVTIRELLAEILRSDPEIEIVGEAGNGVEAVEMTKRLRPDVVTMDIQMPGMDGFEATKRIMIEAPRPIVIVSGVSNIHDVEISLHALRAGALTALPRPLGPSSPDFEEESRRFVSTVKAMSQVKVVRRWPERPISGPSKPDAAKGARVRIVAVAASTGGPAALCRLFSELPGSFPAPILVVQHIASGFLDGLAAWLNAATPLKVKVAEQGEALAPQTVYLAPDDRHLGVSPRSTIMLSDGPPIGGFRPAATFLYDSVAAAFASSAVAVILTGMGQDGVEGLRAVRATGGRIIAQDEQSSVVFGMPRAAVEAGFAHDVLPLCAIASRLIGLSM